MLLNLGLKKCDILILTVGKDDYLKAKLHRLRITKENDKLSYEVRYDMLHKRVYIERWDNRYFLIPIPQGEINKKYGLVQNPGWE